MLADDLSEVDVNKLTSKDGIGGSEAWNSEFVKKGSIGELEVHTETTATRIKDLQSDTSPALHSSIPTLASTAASLVAL